MTWYVASIISCIEIVDGEQPEYPVYEDFYLFEAYSKTELDEKISNMIRLNDEAGDCRLDGKPARQRCIGVRKIRSVYNETPDIDENRPGDGTELTHSFYMASSLHDAELFARGSSVILRCVDDAEDE